MANHYAYVTQNITKLSSKMSFIFMGVLFAIVSTHNAAICDDSVKYDYQQQAMITYFDAGSPLGRFILIRKGKDICAVKFTEAHRGHDNKSQTIFNSGEESFYAEYDWFYQTDSSGFFRGDAVMSGHEKLAQKPLIGIGRLAFQAGETFVKCGPFKLLWMYPTRLSFNIEGTLNDSGIELSPTNLFDINKININNSQHKWYRYDEKRKVTVINFEKDGGH